ncbi:hypothetical protein [Streptomyces sp. NPDC005799]|uniref:hypothetical protein n=1 Tax=Streptomyces sp. NPDC005799 TaxID=3154678 RepID=UPI0034021CFB
MTVAAASAERNGGVPAHQLSAADISDSVLYMAGRDINLHTRQTLSTVPVTRDELAAVRRAWAKRDRQGDLLTTPPAVLEFLKQQEPVVVIAGPRGMGKTAAAVKSLSDYGRDHVGEQAEAPWVLEHVLPDWEQPGEGLLPAKRRRGYILDVSEEIDGWADPVAVAKKIVGHGDALLKKGSRLIVITSQDGWPASQTPGLGRIVVRATAAPSGREIVQTHLARLYPSVSERAWLTANADDQGHVLTDLLGVDMYPSDAAALALELSRIDDSPQAVETARAAATHWRDVVKKVFTATRENADDRALLLAAIALEGLAPPDVLAASRLLLKEKTSKSVRQILTGPDLVTRLEEVEARVASGKVSFAHKPGYPNAVLGYVWRQLSDVQKPLLAWVKLLTKHGALGFSRLSQIADLLVQLATDEQDLGPLDVARAWATSGDQAGREAAASMLATAAADPTLGTVTRARLRDWAQQDVDPARVTAVVCQGSFATIYPRQALTCLRHIMGRPIVDEAVADGEKALRAMAENDSLLPQVWEAITGWIEGKAKPAGCRAFLALLDPKAAPSTVTLLLNDALAHPETADELVTGWCACLADPALADRCERLLEKWAEAVADHDLADDAVVHVLDRVVDEHMVTGPMAAFLLGKEGVAYNLPAVIAMRERLMLRRHERRHHTPNAGDEGTAAL